MKSSKLAYAIAIFVAIILALSATTSCTKERTIVERDTIQTILEKKDTLVNDSLLASASWEIAEAIGVLANMPLRYQKSGTANNWNVAGDYYVFNKNNTGYMYDGAKTRHEILSWHLVKDGERIKLTMTYQNDPTLFYTTVITWDNLIYKNGNLQYSDYYKDAMTGASYHGQAIRFPRK